MVIMLGPASSAPLRTCGMAFSMLSKSVSKEIIFVTFFQRYNQLCTIFEENEEDF